MNPEKWPLLPVWRVYTGGVSEMKAKKTYTGKYTIPKILGLIHILIAACGAAISLLMVFISFQWARAANSQEEKVNAIKSGKLEEYEQSVAMFEVVGGGLFVFALAGVFLSFALGGAGAGLFRYRKWGRTMTIVWSLAVIAFFIGSCGYAHSINDEIYAVLAKGLPEGQEPQKSGVGELLSAFITVCGYPLLCLFLMFRPEVKNVLVSVKGLHAPNDEEVTPEGSDVSTAGEAPSEGEAQ